MLPTKLIPLVSMICGIGYSAFAVEVSAVSGDTFFAKGRAIKVMGVECPTPDTEAC